MSRFSRFRRFLAAKKYIYLLLFAVVLTGAYPLVSDFYTKGEPREALVAQAMIEEGEYVLPVVYGDEVAYKPPMFHWLIVASTLFTDGEVTPLSARLPSIVALLVTTVALFLFVSQRRPISLALMASLVFLTATDPHRFGIMARVDMLLAMFITLSLLHLYVWDEKKRREGIPWLAVLFMSGGCLTKGPVAIALPLLILVIYGLFRRYHFGRLLGKAILMGVLAFIIPLVWYFFAWQKGGDGFLRMVWSENVLRFLGIADEDLFYTLGHEGSTFKPLFYFVAGLLPWTLVAFFFIRRSTVGLFRRISALHLFSLVAAGTILLFYMIPMSKSSAYLLPMYPFVSFFVAEGLYIMVKRGQKDCSLTIFASLLSAIGVVMLLGLIFAQAGVVTNLFPGKEDVLLIAEGVEKHLGLTIFGELLILVGLLTVAYQLMRKNYHKVAFSVILLAFILNFNIDVPIMTHYRECNSAKPFARQVLKEVGEEPLYIHSDLRHGIYNLYGTAFYTKKRPLEVATHHPQEGYMMLWEKDYDQIRSGVLGDYHTEVVVRDSRKIKEGGPALLIHFSRNH